jgi:hypothetical protein
MKITVKIVTDFHGPDIPAITLDVDASETILVVKAKLKADVRLLPSWEWKQLTTFDGKILEDDSNLQDCSLQEDCTLHAMVGCRDAAGSDGFEDHLVKLFAGHTKRRTRTVHLITSHAMVATILAAIYHATGVSLVYLPLCLWSFFLWKAHGRWLLASCAACTVGSCLWIYTAIFSTAGIRTDFAIFLCFGLLELACHSWFDDGDRNLITRKRKPGLDKVNGVLFDVIALGPMCFLQLNAGDYLEDYTPFVGTTAVLRRKSVALLESLDR